jgi:hypothetical protein
LEKAERGSGTDVAVVVDRQRKREEHKRVERDRYFVAFGTVQRAFQLALRRNQRKKWESEF